MDERDVLVTDVRVTALGDSGQYIFEWVDQDEGRVEFLPEQSDYDSYTSEVERALNANGVFIEGSSKSSTVEETSGTSSGTREQTDETSFDPVSSTPSSTEPEDIGSSSTEEDESIGRPSAIGTPSTETQDDSSDSDEGKEVSPDSSRSETYSFMVRITDPDERRKVIEKINDEEAAKRMELTGPFKVTYKINNGETKLVRVEDMGTGDAVEDN